MAGVLLRADLVAPSILSADFAALGSQAAEVLATDTLDLALCMSVNPGWGAQQLIRGSFGKLARRRAALPDHVALGVDGGIHQHTAGSCAQAAANLLVAGSAVFGSEGPAAAYAEIATAAGFR